jgi:hypothetical protein
MEKEGEYGRRLKMRGREKERGRGTRRDRGGTGGRNKRRGGVRSGLRVRAN